MAAGTRRSLSGWVIAGVLWLFLAAVAVWAYLPTWLDIRSRAITDEESSHILLALPAAAWLVWLRRSRFERFRVVHTWAGPLVVLGSVGASLIGHWLAIDMLVHAAALIAVIGATVTVVGTGIVTRFKPAVLVLFFLIPVAGTIRQQIAIPLQNLSAQVTEVMLGAFGAPIERMGNVLRINGQDVAIAEACNGMRMVSALALVSVTFAFSTPMRNGIRLWILLLSPAAALLVNIVRLIPTTLAYGYTDLSTADLLHDVSGWAVLLLALGLMWSFVAMLRWLEIPIDPYPVVLRSTSR